MKTESEKRIERKRNQSSETYGRAFIYVCLRKYTRKIQGTEPYYRPDNRLVRIFAENDKVK